MARLGRVLEAVSEPLDIAAIKGVVEELTGQIFDPGEDWRQSRFDHLLANEYVFQAADLLQRPNRLSQAAWATSQRLAIGRLPQGDVDLLRLERHADGGLHALMVDLKSTTEVKVEHRLQVGFYHLMMKTLFQQYGVGGEPIHTGILYRQPADGPPEVVENLQPYREAARQWFGLSDAVLEIVDDPEAYLRSACDLVTGQDSAARRVAARPFEQVPYCLSYKCDGCLSNEFCMKWSAEQEDLSLLPYLNGVEKVALQQAGITSIEKLARLKDLTPSGELVIAPGQEVAVKQLAATWPVGPRLDELIHRAKQFRRVVRKDGGTALGYLPGKGQSTLPASTSVLNPNLVRIYVEAQHRAYAFQPA
jgi:hypothetical protein